jgi:hypothetical protein
MILLSLTRQFLEAPSILLAGSEDESFVQKLSDRAVADVTTSFYRDDVDLVREVLQYDYSPVTHGPNSRYAQHLPMQDSLCKERAIRVHWRVSHGVPHVYSLAAALGLSIWDMASRRCGC